MGRRPFSEVNTADVLEILTAVWHLKAETARAVQPAHPLGAGVGDRDGQRRMALDDVVLRTEHRQYPVARGVRSSSAWAAEETDHRREVIEAVLGTSCPNKVEAAYARSDLLERRRPLMDDWPTCLDEWPRACYSK